MSLSEVWRYHQMMWRLDRAVFLARPAKQTKFFFPCSHSCQVLMYVCDTPSDGVLRSWRAQPLPDFVAKNASFFSKPTPLISEVQGASWRFSQVLYVTLGYDCSALQCIQPRIVSYEEQASAIREQLAVLFEQEEDFTQAAQTLAAIDLDSGILCSLSLYLSSEK